MELIQPLEGPSIYKDSLAERGEGLHHIQSRVDDIAKTLAAFSEHGICVLMSGKFGEGEFYCMDTERLFGFTYEVVKRRKRPIRRIQLRRSPAEDRGVEPRMCWAR